MQDSSVLQNTGTQPLAETRRSPLPTIILSGLTVLLIIASLVWLQWASQQSITLGYPRPTVQIKPLDASVLRGQPVQFTAQATGRDLKYSWSFEDGSESGSGQAETDETASYTYQTNGQHTVSLIVDDGIGQEARTTLNVTVMPPKPVAYFTASTASFFMDASFDASQSTADESTSIREYDWDFGDSQTEADSYSSYTYHYYSQPGTYTVTLIVKDQYDQASDPYTTQIQIMGYNN